MTWSTFRASRPRSRRLLPEHALVRPRRDARPIPGVDPAERQARRDAWARRHARRFDRTEITSRFALAVSVGAMLLGMLVATQSSNALERAQTAQKAQVAAHAAPFDALSS